MAVLFRVLDEAKPSRAAVLGWAFGVGKYGVGASWIYVSIHDYGPAPVWLAASLVALFVVAMAWFPAFTFIWRWVRRSNRWYTRSGSAPAGLRSVDADVVPHRFRGCSSACAQIRAPLGARWQVLGVSLVPRSATVAVARSRAIRRAGRRSRRFATLPWLVGGGLGYRWVNPARRGPALVQGDIPQDVKWRPKSVAPILSATALSEPYWQRDLVIWRTAITLFEQQALRSSGDGGARAAGAALVFGVPGYERCLTKLRISKHGGGRRQQRHYIKRGSCRSANTFRSRLLRGFIEFLTCRCRTRNRSDAQPCCKPGAAGNRVAGWCADLVRRDARDADVIVTIPAFLVRSFDRTTIPADGARALENGRTSCGTCVASGISPTGESFAGAAVRTGRLDGKFSSIGVTPYAAGDVRCWRDRDRIGIRCFPTPAYLVARPALLSFEPLDYRGGFPRTHHEQQRRPLRRASH